MDKYFRLPWTKHAGFIRLDVSYIIEAELIFILFERLFIQIGFPSSIIYVLDLVNIVLFLATIRYFVWKRYLGLVIFYGLILLIACISALFHYDDWGGNLIFTLIELRNIIRFPVFFLACVTFLSDESCRRIYGIITAFFSVNFLVILYQYFTYHPEGVWTRGDFLNGLFGFAVGGNTFVNVILLVALSFLLTKWSNGELSTKIFFAAVISSLMIAGLIELKAFYFEFCALYGWYLIAKKKSRKEKNINLILIVLVVVFAYIALQIMYQEYPWFRETMSLSGIMESLTGSGYTGNGDLNRFTGVITIAKEFFGGNLWEVFFGVGAGNVSAFSILGETTSFYTMYQASHYNWFSSTYMFAQSGAIGLLLYLGTFVYFLTKRKSGLFWKFNAQIISILAIFLVFYGEALKTDAGYFIYFAIASGFMCFGKEKSYETNQEKYLIK